MRAHGISDFPDPSGHLQSMAIQNGTVTVNGVKLKETAAQFKAAQTACQGVAGGPQAISGPPNPALQQAALAFAQCMRSHGVPNFPDPKVGSNGVAIQINRSSGIDPNSPTFQAAQTACQPIMARVKPPKGGIG